VAPQREARVSELRSVAALYDIHGNAVALEAVLAELEREPPDAVVVGGDVSAGPQPLEVLALLRALPWPVHFIRGNADRVVVMAYDGTAPDHVRDHPLFPSDTWTAARLLRAERDFLAGLPGLARLTIAELGEVLFCHATARSDEERVTVFTPDRRLARVLEEAGAPLLVAGHTHRQFDRSAAGRRMVNAGSVGRPYEAQPGAYWLRLGPGVEHRRTPYDTGAASALFRALGYPSAETALAPVDADAVARRYEEAGAKPVAPESLIVPAGVP
jgi:predicted phosphodiesterase